MNLHQARYAAGIFLLSICFSLLWAACAGMPHREKQPGFTKARSVLLVSIDGLRPEFYLDSRFDAPNLKRLKHAGAYAEGAVPSYPSSTFPNHATLVTGVHPARHGVVSNMVFEPMTGPTINWYWEASYLKVPAIWDVAKQAGKKVAIFGWPVSVGAKADWIVPEIFSPYGIDHDANWALTLRETKPSLMAELQKNVSVARITSSDDYDEWMTEAATYIIRKHQPDLTLMHFRATDEVQHENGPYAEATLETVNRTDRLLGRILEAIDLKTTLVVVVGDHGFDPIERDLHLNAWFKKEGWIQVAADGSIKDWTVLAQPNGNQAAIYSKNPSLEPQILASLRRLEKTFDLKLSVFDRNNLAAMEALPHAVYSVDPPEGFTMGSALVGSVIRKRERTGGTHGAHASRKTLWTGLLATGPGIPPHSTFGVVDLRDVAPTLAKALGIPMKTDGKPLISSVR